jgi:hypothetical protein
MQLAGCPEKTQCQAQAFTNRVGMPPYRPAPAKSISKLSMLSVADEPSNPAPAPGCSTSASR